MINSWGCTPICQVPLSLLTPIKRKSLVRRNRATHTQKLRKSQPFPNLKFTGKTKTLEASVRIKGRPVSRATMSSMEGNRFTLNKRKRVNASLDCVKTKDWVTDDDK